MCLPLVYKQEGIGQWMSLDAEQIMENGVVVGTRNPTGDYLLIDCRFELPYGKAFVCCFLYLPSFVGHVAHNTYVSKRKLCKSHLWDMVGW